MGLSVVGVVAVVMTHSAVDFAIRVPLYFVVLCSMVGLVTGPEGNEGSGVAAGAATSLPRRLAARTVVPAVGVLIVGMVSLFGRMPYNLDSDSYLASAGPAELVRALEWSPASWRVWYHLGNATAAMGSTDEARFGERCVARAAEYDPKNYLVWRNLAEVRLRMNDRDGALEAYRRVKSLRSWVTIPELE
jgi:hypothetical protein